MSGPFSHLGILATFAAGAERGCYHFRRVALPLVRALNL
jgi:hypothetical protein